MNAQGAERRDLPTSPLLTVWHAHRWVVASDAEAAQKLAEERFPGQAMELRQVSSCALPDDGPYELLEPRLQVCQPMHAGYSITQIAVVTCFALVQSERIASPFPAYVKRFWLANICDLCALMVKC